MHTRLRFNLTPVSLASQTPYLVLTPQDFGAVGDGVADDHQALTEWFQAVYETGIPGYFPPGTYRSASTLVWNMNDGGAGAFDRAVNISGPGWGATANTALIKLDSGKQFLINNSSTTLAAFYKSFRYFDVQGNFEGVLAYFGSGSVGGAFNSCELTGMHIRNTSSHANSVALQLQNCYGSRFTDILTNCSSDSFNTGTAMRIVDCNFCTFTNLFPGSALVGLDLVAGGGGTNACAGNTFIDADLEVLGINVRITGTGVRNNTWLGGVMTLTATNSFGIQSTSGESNYFINMTHGGPGTLLHTNRDGIIWKNGTGPGVSSPTLPASAVAITNNQCQPVSVIIWGGAYTIVNINGSGFAQASGGNITTWELNPGDSIAITYTVAPSWVWRVRI